MILDIALTQNQRKRNQYIVILVFNIYQFKTKLQALTNKANLEKALIYERSFI